MVSDISNITNNISLGRCAPPQVVNLSQAYNNVTEYCVSNIHGCQYNPCDIKFAYSIDGVTYTCFMSFDDFLSSTINLSSDYFIKLRVQGSVGSVYINGEQVKDYTTQLEPGFNFTYCSSGTPQSANLYNPYANISGAMSLVQLLTESVSCMIGIPIYYFKLSANAKSKDITFKEYALMDVESVKQIKLIISDGQMPSSKPEFNDWGIDWQSDWETEISKSAFATAFGPTAQPLEGDLIYIPMMKRMWMVNEAYEEKKEAFMWNATTFKLALVKYQEKDSVDLGTSEYLVDSFVKNKYEDLFGDEETLDSGIEGNDTPLYTPSNLYPVYESDATRRYMTVDTIDIVDESTYYKGTVISDEFYKLSSSNDAQIIYQRQYCGENGTVSFIINPSVADFDGPLLKLANIQLNIKQHKNDIEISVLNSSKNVVKISAGKTWFVYLRWSKDLNTIELSASEYVWPSNIPIYKIQPYHYKYDIDNAIVSVSKYNGEMKQCNKGDIVLYNFEGKITNIKVFDVYNDNISELLYMQPTHQHLLVNDTARKLIENTGVKL